MPKANEQLAGIEGKSRSKSEKREIAERESEGEIKNQSREMLDSLASRDATLRCIALNFSILSPVLSVHAD